MGADSRAAGTAAGGLVSDAAVNGWAGGIWTPDTEYSSDTDDIARDFYAPAMSGAISYDRITGFFSSGALLLYWPALRLFVERGGRVRLLCSPRLSPDDAGGLERGYAARTDGDLAKTLRAELAQILDRSDLRRPVAAFAGLVAEGVIDVRFAQVADAAERGDKRMFHDKVGTFADAAGRTIGFRGSANETFLGLSAHGNIESIDAWPSWDGGRDARRAANAVTRFDKLWNGDARGVMILTLPDGLRATLREATHGERWQDVVDELAAVQQHTAAPRRTASGQDLRRQQIEGLAEWERLGKRGILAHATGSGKTVTGIVAIGDHIGPTLVVAPTELVARQWYDQVSTELGAGGRRVHLCGAGNTDWRDRLRTWVTDDRSARVVVAVAPTAASDPFVAQLRLARDLLLVGDEVHRLGAPSYQHVLSIDAEYRLGLSATPERAGDPEGTATLMDYFGGVVHRYGLQNAIDDGALCRYQYLPQVVRLDAGEQQEWVGFTRKIGRMLAVAGGSADALRHPGAKALIMQRARVAKKAAAKAPLAVDLVRRGFAPGQHWLVYCDDIDQMNTIADALSDQQLPTVVYHSAMAGDKAATLRHFRQNGGIVVSIKCLDEGVDIPECDHAVIVASSRNPREFIQRRGRVLRRTDDKSVATIHDVLVVPAGVVDDSTRSLVWGELARAAEFAGHAVNSDARLPLEKACTDIGIELTDLYTLLDAGIEDEGEGDA